MAVRKCWYSVWRSLTAARCSVKWCWERRCWRRCSRTSLLRGNSPEGRAPSWSNQWSSHKHPPPGWCWGWGFHRETSGRPRASGNRRRGRWTWGVWRSKPPERDTETRHLHTSLNDWRPLHWCWWVNRKTHIQLQYDTQTVIREREGSRRWYDHQRDDDMRGVTELSFKKHIRDHLEKIQTASRNNQL